jgi:hypothetical protein
MKKILGLVMGLMMVASISFAADSEKKFELGINGGVGLNLTAGYDLGFGGQVTGLYLISENLALGAGIGYNTFSVTGASGWSDADLSCLALLKYTIGTSSMKPYLLAGAGMGDYIVSFSGASASAFYPEISGGAGLQFPMGETSNFFVQGTVNILIATGGTWTYVPVDVGVNFNI